MSRFASFWYGGSLTKHEYMCINSFILNKHNFYLYSYNQDLIVPEGCELLDASEIFNEEKIFFYKSSQVSGKISAFSNMFRYQMLYETKDVIWVDTDVVCLREDFVDSDYIFARQDDERYNGAVLKFPTSHEAMLEAAEYCWQRKDDAAWGELGPRLVTKIIDEHDLHEHALPTDSIYPIHWKETDYLTLPSLLDEAIDKIENATLLHLWNEILGRKGFDKTKESLDGTLLNYLMQKYLP